MNDLYRGPKSSTSSYKAYCSEFCVLKIQTNPDGHYRIDRRTMAVFLQGELHENG